MAGVRHVTVEAEEADQRLDRWFKRKFPQVGHGRLEKMLRKGEVRLDGARVKAGDRLQKGQVVRVPPMSEPDDAELAAEAGGAGVQTRRDASEISSDDAEFIRGCVVHRDDAVIVLNKPAGLAVQGGSKQTRHVDGLLDALRFDRADRPRLVHRLDKDTSGALVLARTPAAAQALARAFQSRAARKVYWAVVVGLPRPRSGVIKTGLLKDGRPGSEKVREVAWDDVAKTDGAKRAVTDYTVLANLSDRTSWVALRPVTGRTHQLRAHMSFLRTPIVGDGKYRGDVETVDLGGGFSKKLHLHAESVRLPHPTRPGDLVVSAPPPDHMLRTFETLGWRPEDAPANPFQDLDESLAQ